MAGAWESGEVRESGLSRCVIVCPEWSLMGVSFINALLTNFIFGCAWFFLLYTRAFPSCGKQGLLPSCGEWTSHCSGFSGCRAQALGTQA